MTGFFYLTISKEALSLFSFKYVGSTHSFVLVELLSSNEPSFQIFNAPRLLRF
jgi:hypothetical protein